MSNLCYITIRIQLYSSLIYNCAMNSLDPANAAMERKTTIKSIRSANCSCSHASSFRWYVAQFQYLTPTKQCVCSEKNNVTHQHHRQWFWTRFRERCKLRNTWRRNQECRSHSGRHTDHRGKAPTTAWWPTEEQSSEKVLFPRLFLEDICACAQM